MYCGEGTLVKWGTTTPIAATLRCRSWNCENCQAMRRAQLRKLAEAGGPSTFLTLTIKPRPGSEPVDNARALVTAWRALRKLIVKTWSVTKLPFLAVFEAHQSGQPHLHILMRVKYIPQQWISAQMDRLVESPMVDIRRVKNTGQAAIYVAKYVGKAPGHFGTLKRYWHSADWRLKPRDKPALEISFFEATGRYEVAHWEVSQKTLPATARQWFSQGWKVTWLSLWRICGERSHHDTS